MTPRALAHKSRVHARPMARAEARAKNGRVHPNVIDDADAIGALLATTKRIAVLGIKTEAASDAPAFYVPKYLVDAGFDVVPVPVYYPTATSILGRPVFRAVNDVPPPALDMVDVFRRSQDLMPHLGDLLAARPKSVWLQQGIRDDVFAGLLAQAGIKVVQDRCLMVELKLREAQRRRGQA
jgi:predicted CoA-binding protein